MTHHLVVVRLIYLQRMLAGRKRIECRLSSIDRSPFHRVQSGDMLWIKVPSGPIRAVAWADRCEFHPLRSPDDWDRWVLSHRRGICPEREFLDAASWARYASLIWIRRILPISPLRVRKSDRRAWVILGAPPTPGQLIPSVDYRAGLADCAAAPPSPS